MAIARLKTINLEKTENLFGSAFLMLLAGVGFLRTGKNRQQYYIVSSHEGEYLGTIPFQTVASIIWHMRHHYNHDYQRACGNGSITYGHDGLVPNEKIQALMDQFTERPMEMYIA